MGLYLIALLNLSQIIIILEVAIALGLVIFVHELGHFAVAKFCGVKCEKFYLGFDIFGLKLARFRWGETEYGIGILPLGGYVKMLGQEDNPAAVAREIERAKQQQQTVAVTAEGAAAQANAKAQGTNTAAPTDAAPSSSPAPAAAPSEDAPPDQPLFDPRSYLAQSVGKRMAIISAGVVMNVIFAFFAAMAAYGLGISYTPCIVAGVVPGTAAWQAGLEPGDEIVKFGKIENPRFRDLRSGVILANLAAGVDVQVRRPGHEGLIALNIVPDRTDEALAPTIGVVGPATLELPDKRPVFPGSAASHATPSLESGDRIIAVDGEEITAYHDLLAVLTRKADQPLSLTIERDATTAEGKKAPAQKIEVEVPTNPFKTLGLEMTIGPITAIRKGSPADLAAVRAGDVVVAIDGESLGDPLRLPEQLRQRAGESLRLTLDRPGQEQPIEVELVPEDTASYDWPPPGVTGEGQPVAASAIGISYQVLSRVAAVEPESPAAAAGIRPGDQFVLAKVIPPKQDTVEKDTSWLARIRGLFGSPSKQDDASSDDAQAAKDTDTGATIKQREVEVDLSDKPNWPTLMFMLQDTLPGTRIELMLADGRQVELEPIAAADWYNPHRGFHFKALEETERAESIGGAVAFAARETVDFLTMVYRLLQKLVETQVSPKVLGGPLTIFDVAGGAAARGLPELLMFIGMLSANLAVINFLPIPLLDGGHMMFLIVEAIRGKPASERLTVALHYAGFLFILGLMGFVLFLDISRWEQFGGWLGQ